MNKELNNEELQQTLEEQSAEETIEYLEAYITSLVNYNQELTVQLVDLRTQLTLLHSKGGEE